MKNKKLMYLVVSIILITVFYFAWGKFNGAHQKNGKYISVLVDRGTITHLVNANGIINPVALVNVGTQISGTVMIISADYNDIVRSGQILLRMDPALFNAVVRQAEASLSSAKASLALADLNLSRNSELVKKGYISNIAFDQASKERDVALANVGTANGQLERAMVDLHNSVIRSPIDGIVVKRTVEVGQTVAASFATPNLFQIAKDLTHMQIETNVSEGDIANIRAGQRAIFYVDAFPDREFSAVVKQVRLASTTIQNLVTYNVVLDVDNKASLLKPGMTAQVRLVVGEHSNVLRIPTRALRYKPKSDDLYDNSNEYVLDRKANNTNVGNDEKTRAYVVYKLAPDGRRTPVDIRIGLANFRYTEVVSGNLNEHERVVVGETSNGDQTEE